MIELNLDNLVFEIRKSTSCHYRRAKINVKKKRVRIIITDSEYSLCDYTHSIATMINHEFLHWILCSLIGCKWGLKKYDEFLDWQGLYWQEILEETQL